MEKAIKQRLLGGLVLVAGAALFLPMLLDGAGAPLTVPPMPTAPKVPGVEQVAPRLDAEVQTAEQSIDAAHEGRTFTDSAEAAPAVEEDVTADAAAGAVAATPPAVSKPADKAATDLAQDKAAQEKAAAAQKAEQDKLKLAADTAAKAEAAKKAEAVKKAEAAKEAAQKAEAAKLAAAKTTAKPAAASSALPQAWVVQVASLSAKDKADALVQKLRQKNYRAVVHQQGAVWKVIVGPELRKEVAESIKSRLAADPDLKLSGWVQAYKP